MASALTDDMLKGTHRARFPSRHSYRTCRTPRQAIVPNPDIARESNAAPRAHDPLDPSCRRSHETPSRAHTERNAIGPNRHPTRADILSRDEDPPHAVSESAIRAPSSAPAAIKANLFMRPLLRRSSQRRMHAEPSRMHHVTWHSTHRASEGSKAMRTSVFRPKKKGGSDDSVLRRAEYGDASREPMPPERIIDVRMNMK